MHARLLRLPLAVALSFLLLCTQALATWSIVIVNTRTGEVCVASATCLQNFNLRKATPVVIPGVGVAAAQSYLDGIGNRLVIHDQLLLGTSPDEILAIIDDRDPQLRLRQYGMVDLQGRALTFTGSGAGAWAGGVTGQVGDLVYAIQGNVLTGAPVVDDAEAAILNTPGDMAEKVMAAMEAAHLAGGDGRCSCSPSAPDSCGAPPPNFTHSAYCAYFLIARPGDPKKDCDMNLGCGRGAYYLGLNIRGLGPNDPEPIGLLRQEYDTWRASKQGEVDSVESLVIAQTDRVRPGAGVVRYDLELYDLNGVALTTGGATLTLEHQLGSAGLAAIHQVIDHQDGSYTVEVQPGSTPGQDHFAFRVDDAAKYDALLWPPQSLLHEAGPVAPLLRGGSLLGFPVQGLRDAFVHADGLRAWSLAENQNGRMTLWRLERASRNTGFGAPVEVSIDTVPAAALRSLCLTPDERGIVFAAVDPADGISRLYEATRPNTSQAFGEPRLIEELDSGLGEARPWLSRNGMELAFESRRSGAPELLLAERRAPDAHFFAPQPLPSLPADARDAIRMDGDLRLVYRAPGSGQSLRYAERDSLSGDWTDRGPYPGVDALLGGQPIGFALADGLQGPALYLERTALGGPEIVELGLAAGSLSGGLERVSAAAGGTSSYALDAGPNFAGAGYQVYVGDPGSGALAGLHVLPFQSAGITARVQAAAGNGLLQDFVGILDASGRGTVVFAPVAGQLARPELVGRQFALCFAAGTAIQDFISNARPLTIDP